MLDGLQGSPLTKHTWVSFFKLKIVNLRAAMKAEHPLLQVLSNLKLLRDTFNAPTLKLTFNALSEVNHQCGKDLLTIRSFLIHMYIYLGTAHNELLE
jgi:hypothetical protein